MGSAPNNRLVLAGVSESAGINRLETEYERDLQRKLSQSLWPRTLRWEQVCLGSVLAW